MSRCNISDVKMSQQWEISHTMAGFKKEVGSVKPQVMKVAPYTEPETQTRAWLDTALPPLVDEDWFPPAMPGL